MKLSKMFPRRYASGPDLQGRPVTLTIARVEREKMRVQASAPEVEKWVLYFQGAQKGVILNRTLAYQIAEALGCDDTEGWIGKPITLYPEPMTVAGRKVIAIRARPARDAPDQTPPGLAESAEDESGSS